jgi:hypothetical protein
MWVIGCLKRWRPFQGGVFRCQSCQRKSNLGGCGLVNSFVLDHLDDCAQYPEEVVKLARTKISFRQTRITSRDPWAAISLSRSRFVLDSAAAR